MALDDNVKLILGGMQSAGEGLGKYRDDQAKAAAAKAPLSNYKKWIAEVVAGRMDPREAAIRAKLETQQGGGGGLEGVATNFPRPMRPVPQNQADFDALMGAAETVPKGLGLEARLQMIEAQNAGRKEVANIQQEGASTRTAANNETKKEIEGNKLEQRKKEATEKLTLAQQKLNLQRQHVKAKIAALRAKGGNKEDLENIKILQREVANSRSNIAKMHSALMLTPEGKARLELMEQQLDDLQEQLADALAGTKFKDGGQASTADYKIIEQRNKVTGKTRKVKVYPDGRKEPVE